MIRAPTYSVVTLLTVITMAELKWVSLNQEWLQQEHHLCTSAVTALISLL
jgi:hypothetical protein